MYVMVNRYIDMRNNMHAYRLPAKLIHMYQVHKKSICTESPTYFFSIALASSLCRWCLSPLVWSAGFISLCMRLLPGQYRNGVGLFSRVGHLEKNRQPMHLERGGGVRLGAYSIDGLGSVHVAMVHTCNFLPPRQLDAQQPDQPLQVSTQVFVRSTRSPWPSCTPARPPLVHELPCTTDDGERHALTCFRLDSIRLVPID